MLCFLIFWGVFSIICLFNSCRHHQAQILENSGVISSITCPFHHWKYDLQGCLVKAPQFEQTPCVSLLSKETYSWNDMYFLQKKPKIELTDLLLLNKINFDNYQYHSTENLYSPYNWKIFIENYLDDYHVNAIHPGLRALVNIGDLKWYFDKACSLQVVGLNSVIKNSSSKKMNNLKNACELISKQIPLNNVLWMTIYPSTMIEVYPYMISVSTLKPLSPYETINHVDFFFHKDVLALFSEYPGIFMEFYLETAKEDDVLCSAIQKGKQTLRNMSHPNEYFIHQKLEQGIKYFHAYLDQQMRSFK